MSCHGATMSKQVDPYEAGREAEEEAENEIAWAEERDREDEEKWERKRAEKEREFDLGLAEHQERQADEELTRLEVEGRH